MQATAARTLLPCMDEPAYKAVFEVSVKVCAASLRVPSRLPRVACRSCSNKLQECRSLSVIKLIDRGSTRLQLTQSDLHEQ